MDRFSHRSRSEKDPPGVVIVFEPVQLRSGARWRALAFARAALLIWGGVSLAGVAAGAVVFAQGGFNHVLPAPALETRLVVPAKLEKPASWQAVQPTAQIIEVKTALAKPAGKAAALPTPPAQADSVAVAAARVPQARPSEPLVTGSIGARADAPAARRFRRLRDVDLRVPYAPGMPLRMPPPLRESDAVGRHIRHVWAALPLQPYRGPGPDWHGRPRPR